MSTTIKQQIRDALVDGDTAEELRCFIRPCAEEETWHDHGDTCPAPTEVKFDELSDKEYDPGYGGRAGQEVIAFSDQAVYVMGEYDGSEWIEAVPRNPENVSGGFGVIGGG